MVPLNHRRFVGIRPYISMGSNLIQTNSILALPLRQFVGTYYSAYSNCQCNQDQYSFSHFSLFVLSMVNSIRTALQHDDFLRTIHKNKSTSHQSSSLSTSINYSAKRWQTHQVDKLKFSSIKHFNSISGLDHHIAPVSVPVLPSVV